MKAVYTKTILKTALIATCLSGAFETLAEIVLQDVQLSSQKRVSRSDYRYEFDITILNSGNDAQNIVAQLSSTNPAFDVSQTNLSLSTLDADDSAVMEGKLVLIQNRRVRFNPNALVWSFDYDEGVSLNPIEQTFSDDSAYITDDFTNHFVAREIATDDAVQTKVVQSYEQFFDLIDLPSVSEPNESGDIVAFYDEFTSLSTQWNASADNGTSPTVELSVDDERLKVTPQWNAQGDAIVLKFQQFEPVDFTNGAAIQYTMEVADEYAADGNIAVQLILEDENYKPAFFAYRGLTTGGELSVEVSDIGPDYSFGYADPEFDITKIAGIGFQFLANNKSADIGGDIFIDDVRISVTAPAAALLPAFVDDMSAGIANWNAQNDNGTSAVVSLTNNDETLVVSPQWMSESDAFTVKYQQFDVPVDTSRTFSVSVDVKLPQSYLAYSGMAIQLVIEDINYQPGYVGYSSIAGRPGDEFFTLSFDNIGPDAAFGYISPSFDFTQLAGVGLQFVANGKPIDIIGDIVIDNVLVTTPSDEAAITPPNIDGNTSVLFAASDDMAFIKAIDTGLIYSEGMSYGMMLAVMMDDKQTFDKLWKFTKTYMQNADGIQKDFFAWQLRGEAPYQKLDENPAPDGEEYFAMSLFFANNRWGSEEGIFDYQTQANDILNDMINTQTESTRLMMHPEFKQIEFTTTVFADSFTDASYHLPAFYELWALWADENNEFWHAAAQASREFLQRAGHPDTGLFSDYSTHEGEPKFTSFNPSSHKSAFDSHRVLGNIAMDYHWISKSSQMSDLIDKQVNFIESEILTFGNFVAIYEVDGTREPGVNYRGEGRNAMNGYGATASQLPYSQDMVQSLWDQQLPTGEFRYYDGFLYMFSLLHASGEFKIHKPQPTEQ